MTKIEWVKNQDGSQGRSWNPVTGCTKISPGCKNCYAERMARRLAGRCGYSEAPNHFDVTLRRDRLEEPLRRKKPTTYFVCSMSDWLHPDVPFSFAAKMFAVASATRQHTYQFLTKRADRLLPFFRWTTGGDGTPLFEWPLSNVWLGVSVENSDYLWRVEELMKCPAAVRFVSLEPLLGEIGDLEPYLINCEGCGNQGSAAYMQFEQSLCRAYIKKEEGPSLDWVIVGGESGPGARPMHPDWIRDIRDRCQIAGVPFFMKQWGAWAHIPSDTRYPLPQQLHWWPDRNLMGRIGKKAAGRLLDGQEWNEMPIGEK